MLRFEWLLTIACVFISIRIAIVYLRESPRLFSVMAVLAFAWALLSIYYLTENREEAIPGLVEFLVAYIGAILMLEARDSASKNGQSQHVVPLQRWALYFLVVIVALQIVGIETPMGHLGVSVYQSKLFADLLLDVVGSVGLIWGAYALFAPWGFRSIAAVQISYVLAEFAYTVWAWPHEKVTGMPTTFAVLFGILKVGFTVVVGGAVAFQGMSETDRELGLARNLLRFVTDPP